MTERDEESDESAEVSPGFTSFLLSRTLLYTLYLSVHHTRTHGGSGATKGAI